MSRPMIYVAGPLTSPTPEGERENVRQALREGLAVERAGGNPYVPHLMYWLDLEWRQAGVEQTYGYWIAHCLNMVRRCDGLYVFADSPGARLEVTAAHEIGLPVYQTLSELAKALPG